MAVGCGHVVRASSPGIRRSRLHPGGWGLSLSPGWLYGRRRSRRFHVQCGEVGDRGQKGRFAASGFARRPLEPVGWVMG